jgi:hypothetical protein
VKRGQVTVTERVLEQGKALETIQATGPVERAMVWLLLQAYRRRLRGLIELALAWVGEKMLGGRGR